MIYGSTSEELVYTLRCAVYEDRLNDVIELIEAGAGLHAADDEGGTALLWAAEQGNLEIVQYLIRQGAEVDRTDNDGWTPLMIALSAGKVDVAAHLIQHGADLRKLSLFGILDDVIKRSERDHDVRVQEFLKQYHLQS